MTAELREKWIRRAATLADTWGRAEAQTGPVNRSIVRVVLRYVRAHPSKEEVGSFLVLFPGSPLLGLTGPMEDQSRRAGRDLTRIFQEIVKDTDNKDPGRVLAWVLGWVDRLLATGPSADGRRPG